MQEIYKVHDFLGLGRMTVPSPEISKIHTLPVQETLANYEEVAAELRGTQLEWMLTKDVP